MSRKESNVDVLIIGAGPAGVMCANGLARAKINVRIIDKRPIKVAAGQADGIQPRTLEVLQSYGLAEPIFRQAAHLNMAAFYNPSADGGIECTGRVPDVTAPTARYPFECTLHQGEIENIFLTSMRNEGLEVERPIVPTELKVSEDEAELNDPKAYPVCVVLQNVNSGEEEVVHARFVLGADGAHSWVRRTLGYEMEGEQTEYIWGVVDIFPETDFPDIRNRTAVHSLNGSSMVIPREGDKIRLYLQLTSADVIDPATGRVDPNRFGPDKLLEVADKSYHPYKIHATPDKISWWTVYSIGHRVANRFTKNERVFIAGDACHTHSPKAGQGMNASMNDTHNLIWKLAHVLRGWADMSLLRTYEAERRKYAQELIEFDKDFASLFSAKPKADNSDGGISHEEFLKAFQAYGEFTSGIAVHYSPSAIVNDTYQSLASKLTLGKRLIPQIVLRAADSRPFEIQDLLPSTTQFRLIALLGDAKHARVGALVDALKRPDSFLQTLPEGMLDVLSLCTGKKAVFSFMDVPTILRSHWSKVLLDDCDVSGRQGGHAYESYGVSDEGALVIVRPDGYIGAIAPVSPEGVAHLNAYFAGFMKPTPA